MRAIAVTPRGPADPSMGRVQARFADWRVGVASHWAQLWIDRNLALDYTLKSLEKVLDGDPYDLVRDLRRTIKTAGYRLLGGMITAATTVTEPERADDLTNQCAIMAEQLLAELRAELDVALDQVSATLPARRRDTLHREFDRWTTAEGWRLINLADPCAT